MRHVLLMVLCAMLVVVCGGCKSLSPQAAEDVRSLRAQTVLWYTKADAAMERVLDGSMKISEGVQLAEFYRAQAKVAEDRIDRIIADAQAQGMTWWESLFAVVVAALTGGGGAIGWVRAVRGRTHKGVEIVAPS